MMTDTAAYIPDTTIDTSAWDRWTRLLVDRVPVPFVVVVIAAGLLAIAEQVLEQSISRDGLGQYTTITLFKRAVLPVLMMYMLTVIKVIKMATVRSLRELRPTVQVSDRRYEQLVRDMVYTSRHIQLALLSTSAIVVVVLFSILDNPLPIAGGVFLPANWLAAAFILFTYTLVGWAGLVLIYASVKHARALGRMAQHPLTINVLDPSAVLPFGELSLLHSMAPAGVLLILLIGLGRPSGAPDFIVLVLVTIAGVFALVSPLSGVHRQMKATREQALLNICHQLDSVNQPLLNNSAIDNKTLAEITERATKLNELRTLVLRTPVWPFRNGTATTRALLAPTSPLVYFLLTEIIRVYVLPLFV